MEVLEKHKIGNCLITKKYCNIKGYVYTHFSPKHGISFDEEYAITDETKINLKAKKIKEKWD
jgi:hypothetical protein